MGDSKVAKFSWSNVYTRFWQYVDWFRPYFYMMAYHLTIPCMFIFGKHLLCC